MFEKVFEDQNTIESTFTPVITLLGDSPLNINVDQDYIEPGATAFDENNNPLAITITGIVNNQIPGSYAITYTLSNNLYGLISVIRTVLVNSII